MRWRFGRGRVRKGGIRGLWVKDGVRGERIVRAGEQVTKVGGMDGGEAAGAA